jgi:ATP-dependent DNA helicase PIF1
MEPTKEQKDAIKRVKNGKNLFITGKAGTGKSFLVKYLEAYAKLADKKYYLTASTGCAACLIGGTTIHSWSGLGYAQDSSERLAKNIRKKYPVLAKWRATEMLIIDEISMISADFLDKLNQVAKMVRRNRQPFGGIQVIAIGDFYQLPPVSKESQSDTNFCFEAECWDELFNSQYGSSIILKTNMRQKDDFFQEQLDKIRLGEIDDEVTKMLMGRLKVTKDLKGQYGDIVPTKLLPLRRSVDEINQTNLDNLISSNSLKTHSYKTEFTYVSDDLENGFTEEEQVKIQDFVKSNCQSQINLKLCVGAQVMLIHNLDIEKGLVNGSRGVIVTFKDGFPCVKFLDGNVYTLNYNVWTIKHEKGFVEYKQVPLRLAWAVSQHKSQGSSLDFIEVDIGPTIFEYGQTYTTLSRVKKLEGLFITKFDKKKIKSHPKVKEFYKNCEKQIEKRFFTLFSNKN